MASSSTGRWMFFNQNELLYNYAKPVHYGDVRKLRTLKVQVFIFHQNRLLLLQSPTSKNWTAPFKFIPYEKESPQTLWKIVLRMLRQAIEERKLIDLQFPDLNTNVAYVLEQWRVEDEVNWETLQLSIIVTAGEVGLDDRTGVDCEEKFEEMKWFELGEALEVKMGEDLTVGRVRRVFEQLRKYTIHQNHLISIIKAGANPPLAFLHVRDLITNAAHIRLGLQTVYRGYIVPRAIILVRKEEEENDAKGDITSPIFMMEVPSEIHERIELHYQEISCKIPLPRGKSQTTVYVVLGKTVNGDVQFKLEVGMDVLKGVLSGGARLRLEWIYWNEGVRLSSEREGEELRVVVESSVAKEGMRDSAIGGDGAR